MMVFLLTFADLIFAERDEEPVARWVEPGVEPEYLTVVWIRGVHMRLGGDCPPEGCVECGQRVGEVLICLKRKNSTKKL